MQLQGGRRQEGKDINDVLSVDMLGHDMQGTVLPNRHFGSSSQLPGTISIVRVSGVVTSTSTVSRGSFDRGP
jgi:hypothetical protein